MMSALKVIVSSLNVATLLQLETNQLNECVVSYCITILNTPKSDVNN